MAEWVRYSTWDRWRDLTRFRLACEMSLSAYRLYLQGLPITSASDLVIQDPSKESEFKCSFEDFVAVLNDGEQLYKVLLPAYVSLIEDLGRDLIEKLIVEKGVERSHFKGLPGTGPVDEACATYLIRVQVETWGEAILKLDGRSWSSFKGGKAAVVSAVVARNLCAHGLRSYTPKAVNRLKEAGGAKVEAGAPVVLDKQAFKEHIRALKAFGRCLSAAVTHYPSQRADAGPQQVQGL